MFAVIETTTPASAAKNSTDISKVIYISLGVTSAILLLSVAIFVWCYRRNKLKTIERFVSSANAWLAVFLFASFFFSVVCKVRDSAGQKLNRGRKRNDREGGQGRSKREKPPILMKGKDERMMWHVLRSDVSRQNVAPKFFLFTIG